MKFLSSALAILTLGVCNLSTAADYNYVSIKGLIEQEVGRVILPEVYKEMGLSVDIQPLPGKDAQAEATSGRKDGEIMRIWTYGEENPTTLRVPTPYYALQTMAFVKSDSGIVIKTKNDLTKYRIVKVSGVKHTNNITEGIEGVVDVGSTAKMMELLHNGQADVALTNTVDGLLELKRLGYSDIIPSRKPLAVLDLYHYIHEDHKDMVLK